MFFSRKCHGRAHLIQKVAMFVRSVCDFLIFLSCQIIVVCQLDDIRKGNITEEEYTAAVKMICNDLYSYNDNQGILLSYYFNQMVVGKITDPAEFAMKIEAVTVEEISAAAKKIQLDTVFFLDAEEEPIEEGGEE